MTDRRSVAPARGRAGFTLIELIIAVVLSAMILGAVFQLVFAQNRMYGHQQGLADARQTLRSAGSLLAWELRHLTAQGGDIYAVGPDSVSVRSYDGGGVVCRKRPAYAQYGLHSVTGDVEAGDSAMLYIVNSNRVVDDVWRAISINNANTPAAMSMIATCAGWPSTPPIELGIQVGFASPSDTVGMRVGALVRTFHRRTYRMIQRDDQWWLGVRQGAGSYELLTGPLQAGDGLELRYMDAAGATTTVPANVRAVEFVLRAESQLARTAQDVQEDSVVMRVQLRG